MSKIFYQITSLQEKMDPYTWLTLKYSGKLNLIYLFQLQFL